MDLSHESRRGRCAILKSIWQRRGKLIFCLRYQVQFSLVTQSYLTFATPWTAAPQASLSIINCQSMLKLMAIESVIPSNHLILCHRLFLLPSILPSIRVCSSESVLCIRWPRYWSFSFSISPSTGYSGQISFRMDWLALFAVQGTLKSLLQHHSSKALILWWLAFFMVQLSHPYFTTGKTIALTVWIFVSNDVCIFFFNVLAKQCLCCLG